MSPLKKYTLLASVFFLILAIAVSSLRIYIYSIQILSNSLFNIKDLKFVFLIISLLFGTVFILSLRKTIIKKVLILLSFIVLFYSIANVSSYFLLSPITRQFYNSRETKFSNLKDISKENNICRILNQGSKNISITKCDSSYFKEEFNDDLISQLGFEQYHKESNIFVYKEHEWIFTGIVVLDHAIPELWGSTKNRGSCSASGEWIRLDTNAYFITH